MKPSFLIVGCERCGTTSLYANICMHSGVHPAYQKEIEFFDRYYQKGFDWYHQQFDSHPELITGEATPAYFWNPAAAQRIYNYNPQIKIIIITRDVNEAVKSRYNQQLKRGVETESFSGAIKYESIRIAGEIERMKKLPFYYPELYANYAYYDRYDLDQHYKNWEKFIKMILSLEFLADYPDKAMSQVYKFLGLEFEQHEWEHLNSSKELNGVKVNYKARLSERVTFNPNDDLAK